MWVLTTAGGCQSPLVIFAVLLVTLAVGRAAVGVVGRAAGRRRRRR